MAQRTPDLPTYSELMLPILRAVRALGGSGKGREIVDLMVETEGFSDDLVSRTYPNKDKSMLLDRADWARSYCKLGGALESPKRGLFLLTPLGTSILSLPDEEARRLPAAMRSCP